MDKTELKYRRRVDCNRQRPPPTDREGKRHAERCPMVHKIARDLVLQIRNCPDTISRRGESNLARTQEEKHGNSESNKNHRAGSTDKSKL